MRAAADDLKDAPPRGVVQRRRRLPRREASLPLEEGARVALGEVAEDLDAVVAHADLCDNQKMEDGIVITVIMCMRL